MDSACEEVVSSVTFLYLWKWQVGQLRVCNCITPSMPVYRHICASTCMWAFIVSCVFSTHVLPGEHSSASDLPLFFSFHPTLSLLLLLLFSSSSGQPFIIKMILEEKSLLGGEHTLFFHLLPFPPSAIWTKICFSKCCRMIYGMKLPCCLNGFSVI